MNQNRFHSLLQRKKQGIVVATFMLTLMFYQTCFAASMDISPKSLTLEDQSTGTVTVKILDDLENPINNMPVLARSNVTAVATVTPDLGFTNASGQISFSVIGVSNGTATVTFSSNTLSKAIPITVVSNIAPCAIASSSGGGLDDFGPEMMNDGVGKEECSYHWVRTRKNGQKKTGWIQLNWNKAVTVTRMILQTTDCNKSCGEDSKDPYYIDPGRNVGNGIVQYLDTDETTWITDDEFFDEIGDVTYSFAKPITTKAIRIKKISPFTLCDGQQSNPVIFEWKVYGTPSCK